MKAEIKLVKLGENMNGEGLIVCNEEVIFSLSVSSDVHYEKLWRACEWAVNPAPHVAAPSSFDCYRLTATAQIIPFS